MGSRFWEHFIQQNLFIHLIHYSFFIQHNLSGRKSNSSGRAGDFGKFDSKRESWTLWLVNDDAYKFLDQIPVFARIKTLIY